MKTRNSELKALTRRVDRITREYLQEYRIGKIDQAQWKAKLEGLRQFSVAKRKDIITRYSFE